MFLIHDYPVILLSDYHQPHQPNHKEDNGQDFVERRQGDEPRAPSLGEAARTQRNEHHTSEAECGVHKRSLV